MRPSVVGSGGLLVGSLALWCFNLRGGRAGEARSCNQDGAGCFGDQFLGNGAEEKFLHSFSIMRANDDQVAVDQKGQAAQRFGCSPAEDVQGHRHLREIGPSHFFIVENLDDSIAQAHAGIRCSGSTFWTQGGQMIPGPANVNMASRYQRGKGECVS